MAFFSPILISLAILSKAVATPLGALDTNLQTPDSSNAGTGANFISSEIESVYSTPVDIFTSQANAYNEYPDQTESAGGSSQDKGLYDTFPVMFNDPTAQPKDNTPMDLSASQPAETNSSPALDVSYQPARNADITSQGGSCKPTTSSMLSKKGFQPCCDPIDDEPRNAYCCPGGHVEYAQVRIGCVNCTLFHPYSHLLIMSARGISLMIKTTDAESKTPGDPEAELCKNHQNIACCISSVVRSHSFQIPASLQPLSICAPLLPPLVPFPRPLLSSPPLVPSSRPLLLSPPLVPSSCPSCSCPFPLNSHIMTNKMHPTC